MPKSKTNKDRQNKVNTFKNLQKSKNKKMAKALEPKSLPQIQQRPYWNSQADIVLKGFEYEAIMNVISIFNDAVAATQSSIARNVQSGVINMKYFDEQNNELTKEQVDEVTKQYASYFQNKALEEQQEKSKKSLILNEAGEPASSDNKDAISEKPKLSVV